MDWISTYLTWTKIQKLRGLTKKPFSTLMVGAQRPGGRSFCLSWYLPSEPSRRYMLTAVKLPFVVLTAQLNVGFLPFVLFHVLDNWCPIWSVCSRWQTSLPLGCFLSVYPWPILMVSLLSRLVSHSRCSFVRHSIQSQLPFGIPCEMVSWSCFLPLWGYQVRSVVVVCWIACWPLPTLLVQSLRLVCGPSSLSVASGIWVVWDVV